MPGQAATPLSAAFGLSAPLALQGQLFQWAGQADGAEQLEEAQEVERARWPEQTRMSEREQRHQQAQLSQRAQQPEDAPEGEEVHEHKHARNHGAAAGKLLQVEFTNRSHSVSACSGRMGNTAGCAIPWLHRGIHHVAALIIAVIKRVAMTCNACFPGQDVAVQHAHACRDSACIVSRNLMHSLHITPDLAIILASFFVTQMYHAQ